MAGNLFSLFPLPPCGGEAGWKKHPPEKRQTSPADVFFFFQDARAAARNGSGSTLSPFSQTEK